MTDPILSALDATAHSPSDGFRRKVAGLIDAQTEGEPDIDGDPAVEFAATPGAVRNPPRVVLWIATATAGIVGLVGIGLAVVRTPTDGNPSAPTPTTVLAEITQTSVDAASPTPKTPVSTAAPFVPVALRDDGLVLRGDGLGLFPFGTPQAEVVRALTDMLGEPGVDAGAPLLMTTPGANGCANWSEFAMMFPGLVVGFSDPGSGMSLDAWAANVGFATPEGLAVGDTLETAQLVYGPSLELVDQSGGWEHWVYGSPPIAMVDTAVGHVILARWFLPEELGLLSAGAGCEAEAQRSATLLLIPPSDEAVTVIDLSQPSPQIEPTTIASYPLTVDWIEGAQYHVMAVGTDRVAVLDAAADIIRILDAASGAELAVHAVEGSPGIVRGGVFVGPDDVLYISTTGIAGPPGFAAFALSNGRYAEVAAVQHGSSDGLVMLGAYGITAAGVDDPLMRYVGTDGAPSGASLDIAPLSWNLDRDTLRIRRGGSSWTVTYVANTCLARDVGAATCVSVQPGPGDSVVLTDYPVLGGTPGVMRLTLLQTTASSWDTDWNLVGVVGDSLLVTRTTNNRVEIGLSKTA